MFKCICGKEFKSKPALNSHKGKCKIVNPNYKHPTINKIRSDHNNGWMKGLTKENSDIVRRQNETYRRRLLNGEIQGSFTGKHHSEETKEKIRQARFKYLQQKRGDTAWEKVQRGDLTFLEEKFRDVIEQYKLYEKYDIIFNYSLYPYFVDFAFTNIKLGVELDGSCHFKYCTRIKHDIERDNLLFEKYNWKMFRIAFNDNWDDKIQELLNILKNVENYNNKSLENRLYYNRCNEQDKKDVKKIRNQEIDKVIKKETKQKIKTSKKSISSEQKEQQIEQIRQHLLNSNIDFSKYGWVGKAAEIIGIRYSKVCHWMRNNMLEFYNTQCFKRKQN